MKKTFLSILAVLLTFSVYADCENPMSQAEMNRCAYESYEAAEQELGELYAQLMNGDELDSEGKYLLQVSQAIFEGYRSVQCELETIDSRGGSIRPLLMSTCMEEMTKTRIEKLSSMTMGY